MKTAKYLSKDVVIKRAVDALVKALGPVEAFRFMNIPKRKRMESIKRHRDWQKTLSKTKFFDEIFSG